MQLIDRVGRRLKLRDLHVLMAVAERGSMAKAAHDLAVSQPVISKTIADLERTLGVRLLDRGSQGVEPTAYGRALLRRSIVVFDELRESIKEIELLKGRTTGEVRVGALLAMLSGLLPVAVDKMRERYPQITVHVRQLTTSPVVYENLRQRTVDFIVGRPLRGTREKDLNFQPLFDEPLFVVTGVQNRWATRRKVTIADLTGEAWILPEPDTEVGTLVADVFDASGLEPPRAAVVCSPVEMILALLATGRYLAILPRSILWFSRQRHSVKVLPVKLPVQPKPVGVVTLKNRTLSPAAQLLIDHIRLVAQPLTTSRQISFVGRVS
jgi:DNA-binding transcriptional LysR family regulator